MLLAERKAHPDVILGILSNFTPYKAKKKGLSGAEDPFKIVFCLETPAFWEHTLGLKRGSILPIEGG